MKNTVRLKINYFLPLIPAWMLLIGWPETAHPAPLAGNLHTQISEGMDADTARAPFTIEGGRVAMLFALRSEAALATLNAPRISGGNETSTGDFYANLIANLEYDTQNGCVGFVGDIVPEDSVLNFHVQDKQNDNNDSRMRADGFLSRPYALTHIYYARESFTLRLGAMKFAGLEPLDETMTAYYATRLTPIVLSEHYDKGARIDVAYSDWLNIRAGVINGDWETGEPDVFTAHDSHANSSPGVTGVLTLHFKGLQLEGSALENRIGSNPGQKTYDDHWFAAIGYNVPQFQIRGFYGKLEKGWTWGPEDQRDWPPERTSAYGLELALRGIADLPLDIYAGWSKMQRDSGDPAGLIWIDKSTTYEQQWTVGSHWRKPLGLDIISVNLSLSNRSMDGLQTWKMEKHKEYVCFLGVELDYKLLVK